MCQNYLYNTTRQKLKILLIPFLEKYVTKSEHHIAIGDHEDLKKDLSKKHK